MTQAYSRIRRNIYDSVVSKPLLIGNLASKMRFMSKVMGIYFAYGCVAPQPRDDDDDVRTHRASTHPTRLHARASDTHDRDRPRRRDLRIATSAAAAACDLIGV